MIWNRQQNWMCKELLNECEAFLGGQLAECYSRRGASVPVPAWTNLLAHGDEQSLDRAQEPQSDPTFVADECWLSARSYLATEVLDLAARHGSLSELQQTTLVPLELHLVTEPDIDRWDVRSWVAAVRDALGEYCRRCERVERREKADH